MNGHEDDIPKIVQDINSGVIGAILTVIITLLLLSNQTDSQELLAKNSVVYEEKLKMFNGFLELLSNSLEDGKLSSIELKTIIFKYSMVRIHLSSEGAKEIEKAISSIDIRFFFVDENSLPRFDNYIEFFTKVCNVFRRELYQGKGMEDLAVFDFINFKSLAFKRRYVKLPVHSIDHAIKHIRESKMILYENKIGEYVSFTFSEVSLKVLHELYLMIREVLKDFSGYNVLERFVLNRHTIDDGVYLGLLNIQYFVDDIQFATLGVSQKNRLYFKIKMEDIRNFSFEEDTVVSQYKELIREDLRYYFSLHKKKEQG